MTSRGQVDWVASNRWPAFDAPGVGLFGGDGGRPRNLIWDELNDLEVTHDGGLLIVHTLGDPTQGLVRFLASRQARHPALALRVTLPARRRVGFIVTRRARLKLRVRGEGRSLRLRTTAGPGPGRFRLPRSLPSGGYELRLSAVTNTGARLVQRRAILYARRLPVRMAKAVVMYDDDYRRIVTPCCIDARVRRLNDSKPGRCRRFGPRRIDCESLINEPGRSCFEVISTSLDRHGELWAGRYGGEGCGGQFKRRPRTFSGSVRDEDVPLLGGTSMFGF